MIAGGDSASDLCTDSDVNDMNGAQGFQSLGAGHRHRGGFELLLQRASQQEGQGCDENVRPHPIGPVMVDGAHSFQLLQLFKSSGDVPLVYYVFDLLFLEGKDLRNQPLNARRKLLTKLPEKAPENIRLSGELRGAKDELLRVAREFGLEGLVAKKPSSLYESGRRSGTWVKYK